MKNCEEVGFIDRGNGMAKQSENMINTSECKECEHGSLEKISKSKILVHCNDKGRCYLYGQYVPCDNKRKVKKNETAV